MGKIATRDDLLTRISALEAKVAELSKSTLGTSTVRNNVTVVDNSGHPIAVLGTAPDGRVGLLINDTSGVPQVRLGQLAAGGYGLEAVGPSGQLTTLGNFIFGPQVASILTNEGTNSVAYTDLATPGPSVTVNIGTNGKALVFYQARASWSDGTVDGANGGWIALELSGANTQSPSIDGPTEFGFFEQVGGTTFTTMIPGVVGIVYFTGLNAGSTTFKMKYLAFDGTKTTSFKHRLLAVFPY